MLNHDIFKEIHANKKNRLDKRQILCSGKNYMQKYTKIAIVLLIIFAGTIGIQNIVFADAPGIAIQMSSSEMATVVLVGAIGGLLHAYQGYRTGKEDFDKLKFFDGVITCILSSVPLAIGAAIQQTASGQPLNVFTYVLIFFASIGLGFQIQQTRKSTIPSNQAEPPK